MTFMMAMKEEEQTQETKNVISLLITYDWLLGASPMQTASSASFTWRASLSMVE